MMNLAVFLPGWVGDAVMATPALRALRSHFGGARLFGVVKRNVADVFGGGDWFDELLPDQGGVSVRNVGSIAWRLRKRAIDLAVLFPNSFRTALVARLGGCKRRIGYARNARSLFLTDALPAVVDERGRVTPSPVLEAYNLLAVRAGCPAPSRRIELFTTDADEAAARRVWDTAGLGDSGEVVCLNPGAAFGAAKFWPSEHFADLARELAVRQGCGVLVLCGPAERDISRAIACLARHPSVRSLADYTAPDADGPPLSLGLSKALVRRCDLLVTTDSGPRHFAAAFNRPVVTLFGPTHIAWTETYHPLAVHLQKRVECGPCQRRVCPFEHHRCMRELLPAEVFAAVQRLRRPAPHDDLPRPWRDNGLRPSGMIWP
jgi:heptosyltransferase-2